jgi:hypothetical protein
MLPDSTKGVVDGAHMGGAELETPARVDLYRA